MIGQGVGAFSTLLLFVVGWVIGLRLVLLWRRTRRVPELTIGLGILLIGGLSYPLAGLSTPLRESAPGAAWACLVASATISHIGLTSNCIFNWKVFRPSAGWARLLVALSVAAIAIGFAGNLAAALHGGVAAMAGKKGWTLFLMAEAAVAFGWGAVESLVYYDKLRRRLVFGMADPIVANRFLLWGISSAATVIGCLVDAFFAVTSPLSVLDPVALLVSGASGAVSAVVMTLTFVPPSAYVRFIEARYAATTR
jgi:hypothetical protein